MKIAIKPSHLISLPALALAYAVFLIWWLNRDEGQSRLVANAFPDTVNQAETKPAAMLLADASRRPASDDSEKNAAVTDRRYKAANALSAQPVQPSELYAFKPVLYTEGQPFYEGEPVTAYVRVGSTGRQAALTVNQGGEYPQLLTEPGEEVQIRLAFTRTEPGSPIALTAQDGGLVVLEQGARTPSSVAGGALQIDPPTRSTAGVLDAQRQLGFAFRVSEKGGRITSSSFE